MTHLRNLTLDRCAPSKWDVRLILTPSWKEALSVRRLKRWLVGYSFLKISKKVANLSKKKNYERSLFKSMRTQQAFTNLAELL